MEYENFVKWANHNQNQSICDYDSFLKLFENNQINDIVIENINYNTCDYTDNTSVSIWVNFNIEDVSLMTNANSLEFDVLYIINAIFYNNYAKILDNGHIYCKNKHSIINANAKFWYDNDYFKITKSFEIVKNNLTNKYSIVNENGALYNSDDHIICEETKEILTWMLDHSTNKFGYYLNRNFNEMVIYLIDHVLNCSVMTEHQNQISNLIRQLDDKINKCDDNKLKTLKDLLEKIESVEISNNNCIELYHKFKYSQYFLTDIQKIEFIFNDLTKLFGSNHKIKISISDDYQLSIDNHNQDSNIITSKFILFIIHNYGFLKKFL